MKNFTVSSPSAFPEHPYQGMKQAIVPVLLPSQQRMKIYMTFPVCPGDECVQGCDGTMAGIPLNLAQQGAKMAYDKDTVIEKILILCDGMTKKDALDVLSIVSSKINSDSVYLYDRKNTTHQEASRE